MNYLQRIQMLKVLGPQIIGLKLQKPACIGDNSSSHTGWQCEAVYNVEPTLGRSIASTAQ